MPTTDSIPGIVPIYEDFARCIRCGLCLNNCPTYRLWQLEADSPRGRIRQMVLVNEGELPLSAGFVDHIDKCLDCRACETACPSGVEYGKLVEHARAQIEKEYRAAVCNTLGAQIVHRSPASVPGSHCVHRRNYCGFTNDPGCRTCEENRHAKLLGLAERERLLPRLMRDFSSINWAKHFPREGNGARE